MPGRVGINRFLGYDPIAIDIPIQFENYSGDNGQVIEQNIQTLERSCWRATTPYSGSALRQRDPRERHRQQGPQRPAAAAELPGVSAEPERPAVLHLGISWTHGAAHA